MCSAILTALNRWTNESSGKFLAGPNIYCGAEFFGA
jgi:hypothetical protein